MLTHTSHHYDTMATSRPYIDHDLVIVLAGHNGRQPADGRHASKHEAYATADATTVPELPVEWNTTSTTPNGWILHDAKHENGTISASNHVRCNVALTNQQYCINSQQSTADPSQPGDASTDGYTGSLRQLHQGRQRR